MLDPTPPTPNIAKRTSQHEALLRATATRLESTFLSEMLKAAGVGKARETMGGGAGEEQFASFLRDAQADAITRRGGLGLSEVLFNALKETSHDKG